MGAARLLHVVSWPFRFAAWAAARAEAPRLTVHRRIGGAALALLAALCAGAATGCVVLGEAAWVAALGTTGTLAAVGAVHLLPGRP